MQFIIKPINLGRAEPGHPEGLVLELQVIVKGPEANLSGKEKENTQGAA